MLFMKNRYYVDIDEAIIDNETHRQYETWNLVDIEAICDKLNEYENKLEQKEREFNSCAHNWKIMYDEAKEVIKELEKENNDLNSIKRFAEKKGINIFHIDKAFRNCWNDNKELVTENRILKECLDEADDLIKSHLSSHYNRKWENYCKNKGLNLKIMEVKDYD